MIRTLFNDIIKAAVKWWKRIWFEAKLKARLGMIKLEKRIESESGQKIEQRPIYSEKPIDPVLQPGESQKLGGAMELRAPWYNDEIQPQRQDGVQEASRVADRK